MPEKIKSAKGGISAIFETVKIQFVYLRIINIHVLTYSNNEIEKKY